MCRECISEEIGAIRCMTSRSATFKLNIETIVVISIQYKRHYTQYNMTEECLTGSALLENNSNTILFGKSASVASTDSVHVRCTVHL